VSTQSNATLDLALYGQYLETLTPDHRDLLYGATPPPEWVTPIGWFSQWKSYTF
jgi:hypothetical protein